MSKVMQVLIDTSMDQREVEIDIKTATKSQQMVSLKKEELSDNAKNSLHKGDVLRYHSFKRRDQLGSIMWKNNIMKSFLN